MFIKTNMSIKKTTHHLFKISTYLCSLRKLKNFFNRSFLLIILLLAFSSGFAQSYLGVVTKQVNFRQGPGSEYSVITSLKPSTQIFVISLNTENDFYNVIDIATDREGYIHKSFIALGEQVKLNESGMFTPSGKTSAYNPEVEIFNNTSLKLTLKLEYDTYIFSPKQKKTITLRPGSINYRASAPGVIPNIGMENIDNNMGYSWEFYIVTERR